MCVCVCVCVWFGSRLRNKAVVGCGDCGSADTPPIGVGAVGMASARRTRTHMRARARAYLHAHARAHTHTQAGAMDPVRADAWHGVGELHRKQVPRGGGE